MTSLKFMQKYELFVRSHISGVQINIKIIHGCVRVLYNITIILNRSIIFLLRVVLTLPVTVKYLL